MPLMLLWLVPLAIGSGVISWQVGDGIKSAAKWSAIGGAAYLAYQAGLHKKIFN